MGGGGFIGTHLAMKLRDHYKVFATFHRHKISLPGVTYLPFGMDNKNWIKRVMYTVKPDVIIYAAGNNNVEWSENNPRIAEGLHVNGATIMAGAADIMQPKFIFLSNSYVFDGAKGNYHEQDTVLPLTTMGRVKLGGENVIKSKCLNYIIIRSSPLIGRGNAFSLSYLDRLRMAFDANQHMELSNYELQSFAPVQGLCDLVARVVESGVKNRVLHYGGLTRVTSFEFAQKFAKHFGYNPDLVVPKAPFYRRKGAGDEFIFDYSLNTTQAVELLKVKPFLLEECFDLIDKQLVPHF